jgi:hypothetical protein
VCVRSDLGVWRYINDAFGLQFRNRRAAFEHVLEIEHRVVNGGRTVTDDPGFLCLGQNPFCSRSVLLRRARLGLNLEIGKRAYISAKVFSISNSG